MAQQDEYFMFMHRNKIAPPTETEDIVLESIRDALLEGTKEIGSWIETLDRECEVLSHDVLTYKDMLFLSVLVRYSPSLKTQT